MFTITWCLNLTLKFLNVIVNFMLFYTIFFYSLRNLMLKNISSLFYFYFFSQISQVSKSVNKDPQN